MTTILKKYNFIGLSPKYRTKTMVDNVGECLKWGLKIGLNQENKILCWGFFEKYRIISRFRAKRGAYYVGLCWGVRSDTPHIG